MKLSEQFNIKEIGRLIGYVNANPVFSFPVSALHNQVTTLLGGELYLFSKFSEQVKFVACVLALSSIANNADLMQSDNFLKTIEGETYKVLNDILAESFVLEDKPCVASMVRSKTKTLTLASQAFKSGFFSSTDLHNYILNHEMILNVFMEIASHEAQEIEKVA